MTEATLAASELHVFNMDDCDKVIARNVDDAWVVWCEYMGSTRNDDCEPEQLPDNKSLPIMRDPGGGDMTTDTMTCGEWAAKNGRGFLCTTEW